MPTFDVENIVDLWPPEKVKSEPLAGSTAAGQHAFVVKAENHGASSGERLVGRYICEGRGRMCCRRGRGCATYSRPGALTARSSLSGMKEAMWVSRPQPDCKCCCTHKLGSSNPTRLSPVCLSKELNKPTIELRSGNPQPRQIGRLQCCSNASLLWRCPQQLASNRGVDDRVLRVSAAIETGDRVERGLCRNDVTGLDGWWLR
jgi:hypothetical protein